MRVFVLKKKKFFLTFLQNNHFYDKEPATQECEVQFTLRSYSSTKHTFETTL